MGQSLNLYEIRTNYNRMQFSILYPWNCNLYVFQSIKNPNVFLCSKNSHSALYISIIFVFWYICKRNKRNRLVCLSS